MIKQLMLLVSCSMMSAYCMFNPAVHDPQAAPQAAVILQNNQPAEQAEQDTCSVCLEAFDDKERIRIRFNCSGSTQDSSPHEFCPECVLGLMKSSRRCPLCRDPIRINKAVRLENAAGLSDETKAELRQILNNVPQAERPVAKPPRPVSRVDARQPAANPPNSGSARLPYELLAALLTGLVVSDELKQDLNPEEKRKREVRRTSYAPLLLGSNIILSNLNGNRFSDWRTYLLWFAGIAGGAFIGKFIPKDKLVI